MNPEQELEVEGATDDAYIGLLQDVILALRQVRSMARGEGQSECGVCGDGGHTVETCHHNPLLRVLLGDEAASGSVWRCFHCNAIFTNAKTAEDHFGISVDEIARCLREKAEVEQ